MTQSIPLGSDARERFLLEIAAVVPPQRVTEVHFFAPLRQGPMETGVAVIAAMPEGADAPEGSQVSVAADAAEGSQVSVAAAAPAPLQVSVAAAAADQAPVTDTPLSEIPLGSEDGGTGDQPGSVADSTETAQDAPGETASGETAETPEFPEGARLSARHVVYSARYRWTRKGPERGRWESEVVAEADAPLLTVETVVQGVTRRSAEPLEVEKLDGDTVRAMIAKAQQRWPTTP